MADVTVEAAADISSQLKAQRHGPVWTDEDTGYIFFINSANDIRYRKTTDGGASWAASVLIDATFAGSLDIWFDKWTPGDSGTLIHIWWLERSTDDVHWRTLDTSSDTLGTDRIVFNGSTFASVFNRGSNAISGTKAVGGNLYVQFWGDAAGERGFYRSTNGGTTWTSRTDGADGNAIDEVICLPDDDSADTNDIVMIYWDRTANEISIKKYDDSDGASGSWGETSISDSMQNSTAVMQMSAVVRHSDGHIILAAWTALDPVEADADLKVWDITLATPTVTAKTDVITDTDDCVGVALFIDQNNDDLYCAYLGNEDGSETYESTLTAFYKKSTDDAGTWGSQTAYQEGAADDERYIDAGHSTPGSAAGRFEPLWFNADLLDLFVNKVNSVEITVGGITNFQTLAATGGSTLTLSPIPIFVKTLSVVESSILTLSTVSTFFKTLAATAGSTATFVRKISKILASTAGSIATLAAAEITLKTLSVVELSVITLSTITTFFRTLAATAVSTATLATVSTFARTLSVVESSVVTLGRVATHFRTLSVTEISVASLVKKMFQTLSATELSVATLEAAQLILKTLSATAGLTATLATAFIKVIVLSATELSILTLQTVFQAFRTLTATTGSTATIAKVSTYLRTLAVVEVSVPSLSTAAIFYKVLSVSASVIASIATLFIGVAQIISGRLPTVLGIIQKGSALFSRRKGTDLKQKG